MEAREVPIDLRRKGTGGRGTPGTLGDAQQNHGGRVSLLGEGSRGSVCRCAAVLFWYQRRRPCVRVSVCVGGGGLPREKTPGTSFIYQV